MSVFFFSFCDILPGYTTYSSEHDAGASPFWALGGRLKYGLDWVGGSGDTPGRMGVLAQGCCISILAVESGSHARIGRHLRYRSLTAMAA